MQPEARGLYVQALLRVKIDQTEHNQHYVLVPLETPGVWGIDPNASEEHWADLARNELDVLWNLLTGLSDLPMLALRQSLDGFDITREWDNQ
jgi:hypothetical protein